MTLGPRTRRAGTTWYLQANTDGTYDVLKRGRAVLTGASGVKAKSYLRSNLSRGDRAFSVEPDGYRTPMLST